MKFKGFFFLSHSSSFFCFFFSSESGFFLQSQLLWAFPCRLGQPFLHKYLLLMPLPLQQCFLQAGLSSFSMFYFPILPHMMFSSRIPSNALRHFQPPEATFQPCPYVCQPVGQISVLSCSHTKFFISHIGLWRQCDKSVMCCQVEHSELQPQSLRFLLAPDDAAECSVHL